MLKRKQAESNECFGLSQFELTKKVLNNLKHFKLSPTTINVLWYLTSCYNPKHGYVFPRQSTIAENLRCSERSVIRAIQSLVKEGLIIVECKTSNRYRFTSRLTGECLENLSKDEMSSQYEKKSLTNDNLSYHIYEQKKEEIKEQHDVSKNSNSIEFEEFKILKDYAIKHGAKNVNAYINVLRKNGGAEKIICEYKKQQKVTQKALRSYKETQEILKRYEEYKKDTTAPYECEAWQELGKKIHYYKVKV